MHINKKINKQKAKVEQNEEIKVIYRYPHDL